MKQLFGGTILNVCARLIIPFSMIYAVYVLAAGEESPGGGFQAGAVLALGFILFRLSQGRYAIFRIEGKIAIAVAGLGAFFYVFTGWMSLFNGGQFLEYGKLPFGWLDYEQLHALGIFLIEAGVTVGVMMTIVGLVEALIMEKKEGESDDD